MTLQEHIRARIGMSGNLITYLREATELILNLCKNPNKELAATSAGKMQVGRFYFLQYNYNGNKIWAPILAIDFRVVHNKPILYALNIDYLPPPYRIKYFDLLMSIYGDTLEKNKDIQDVKQERKLPEITFEGIYNSLLKNGGYQYAITAFKMEKIKQAFVVSTNILHWFLMVDVKMMNAKGMKEMYDLLEDGAYRKELGKILQDYHKLLETYSMDSQEFHKRLKAFQEKFKLTQKALS